MVVVGAQVIHLSESLARALARMLLERGLKGSWAKKKPRLSGVFLMERTGIEPVTFGLQSRRSPS